MYIVCLESCATSSRNHVPRILGSQFEVKETKRADLCQPKFAFSKMVSLVYTWMGFSVTIFSNSM